MSASVNEVNQEPCICGKCERCEGTYWQALLYGSGRPKPKGIMTLDGRTIEAAELEAQPADHQVLDEMAPFDWDKAVEAIRAFRFRVFTPAEVEAMCRSQLPPEPEEPKPKRKEAFWRGAQRQRRRDRNYQPRRSPQR